MSRLRSPLWPSLTVVGPDGAGKSSLVRALAAQGKVARHEHFRPFSRPGVRDWAGRPQDQVPYPYPVAAAKTLFLAVEQLLAEIPRRIARREGVLVQERGWWDQAADPARYRLPSRLLALVDRIGALLPRPSYLLLITAPVSVIRSRKRELDGEEIERQIEFWLTQARRAQNDLIVLDTSAASADDLAEQVWKRLRGHVR